VDAEGEEIHKFVGGEGNWSFEVRQNLKTDVRTREYCIWSGVAQLVGSRGGRGGGGGRTGERVCARV